ncbi:MAG: peroxide stress protein YaaA [Clostridiales bacterium]|jgi:cytoplasmic iron level regulating protein YaaA (DUF328/UPF0246 family)|nr:peroxide stress protein YaaA [Clostridiales bacterium]
MIAILSPARNTRAPSVSPGSATHPAEPRGNAPPAAELPPTMPRGSAPLFPKETRALVKQLRILSPWQLESLLDVRPERALELYRAYQDFFRNSGAPLPSPSPSLLAFYGAAYRSMAPQDFSAEEFAFAQGHLRILSALYGLLRPLDGIMPHRLGLGRDFSPGGADLYTFWGDRLYRELFRNGDVVVNIASAEYARLVTAFLRPGDTVVTCRFLIGRPGGARGTVSTVRAARGLMARYIVKNRVTEPEGLKEFDADGYRYIPGLSRERELVFVKPAAPPEFAPALPEHTERKTPKLGGWEGKIWMSDDFDAPLEDFEENSDSPEASQDKRHEILRSLCGSIDDPTMVEPPEIMYESLREEI